MMSNKDGKENIRAAMILEVIGRPPEHLVATLEDLMKQIRAE